MFVHPNPTRKKKKLILSASVMLWLQISSSFLIQVPHHAFNFPSYRVAKALEQDSPRCYNLTNSITSQIFHLNFHTHSQTHIACNLLKLRY